MGFLAPWFLAGVAAVGLPVWIHLLRQYRSTPQPFSSLMFFERRTQSSIKHRRIKYFALLALRVLLLALLALAFADPFVNRMVTASSLRRNIIYVVDHSFSMRYGTHLARAKQDALDTVAKLPSGTKAQVIALDSQARYMTQMIDDRTQLKAAVQGIEASDQRSSYGELARALRTMSAGSKTALEVHLFSDMQKSSMPPAFTDLKLGDNTDFVFHTVAEAKEPNWFVENVTAPGKIYDPKKVRVQTVIAGVGTEAATRKVSLVLDGKVLETKDVTVPANGRVTAEFLKLDAPYGFHKGEIRIEPSDTLKEDDRFPFAVERADPHRVLFLHGAGDNRAELYYRTALEAAPDGGYVMEPLAVDQAANQSLSKYAFVVLSDVASLPFGLEDALKKYVTGGGSLFVALGPSSVNLRKVPVIDAPIQGSRISGREGERFQAVTATDPEHPTIRRANRLDGLQFYQAVLTDASKARVIAKLSNQTPLLYEQPAGEGRVLVFASTFDNISNDFPLHSSFLPFVEETARYLGGQQDRSTNLAVDSFVDLRTAKEQGASVDVIDPLGQRPLTLKEATTIPSFQVTREGFYDIHRANGRQELVAVHADRRESDLATIPQETLDLWKATGKSEPIPTGKNGGPAEQSRPHSLWRYALLLVLLFAITESIFASRYLSVQKDFA
jgi:hypothetical protein